ncbi:MAG: hypothetical protein HYU46_05630 [Deltaproteobacteria bacterium]|nr:hypothetical protein [Deltaproteobacteria bacterium]
MAVKYVNVSRLLGRLKYLLPAAGWTKSGAGQEYFRVMRGLSAMVYWMGTH